jgi:hypothetical protein
MHRKTHALKVSVPIPPHITPDEVISLLHTHAPILKQQAFVTSWQEISHVDLDQAIRNDLDFFKAARHDAVPAPGEPEVKIYSVTEAVPLIPHVGKWAEKAITFPSRMQNVRNGVRAQANAPGGIIVKSDFRVEKADINSIIDGRIKSESDGEGEGSSLWQLTEESEIEANSLLLPLVAGDMEKAHLDLCKKVIQMLVDAEGVGSEHER